MSESYKKSDLDQFDKIIANKKTDLKKDEYSIKDSIEAFKTILSGELDSTPEQAFYMVGGIEEVLEKAKELESSSA